MHIKVLGSGCAKCKTLEQLTRQAVAELGVNATVEKVEDFAQIAGYNVLATPALVIEDELVLSGHLVSVEKLKELLARHITH